MKEDTTPIDPTWMQKTGGFARDMKRDAELAEQCYVNPSEFDYKKYAALIRADEREECAKVCAEIADANKNTVILQGAANCCAASIRARSKA
jgi:hypothetical protein